MARQRFIKPGFFVHGELYDAEASSGLPLRIAFAGLWCQSDKRGVFRAKARELKNAVLPYDDVDMDDVLRCLHRAGFVQLYVVDGKEYGFIPTFQQHQTFHVNERPSNDPGPERAQGQHRACTVPAQGQHADYDPTTATTTGAVRDSSTHPREVPPMFARLVARMQREPDRWAVVDFLEAQAKPEGWLGPITAALDGLDMPGGKPASPEAVAATCRDFMTKADHERTPHFFRICVAKFMAAGRPSGSSAADKMARTDAAIAELRNEGAA